MVAKVHSHPIRVNMVVNLFAASIPLPEGGQRHERNDLQRVHVSFLVVFCEPRDEQRRQAQGEGVAHSS